MNCVRKYFFLSGIFACLFSTVEAQPVQQAKEWLSSVATGRKSFDQVFSNTSLNKKEATEIAALLIDDANKRLRIALENGWKNKLFIHDNDSLKFWYKIFGEKPLDGRSLYISMHGGGN